MSVPFSAADAVGWTGALLARGDAATRFHGVSTDSRGELGGRLFVAIRGPHHDAHAYLEAALAGGAAGLMVERAEAAPAGARVPVLVVDDTTAGLGCLAAGHRSGFTGPVVAITGSNGKTTTKEMCAAILGVAGPCLKNRGNLNNAYGLPLTLLEREASHRALVVEIGMNHRGEIAPLAAIARPTVGVITNVGSAHIEHLGSREEIALEKGDLVAALPPAATAVLNADDARVMAQATRTPARVLRFGTCASAEVRALDVRAEASGHAFRLVTPAGEALVRVEGLGEATVSNALAAAAAALATGAPLGQLVEGLARYAPIGGRMQPRVLAGGVTLIDDTYNANPQSMEMALRSLARLRGGDAGVAVLGDMGELGPAADAAHRDAGALAAQLGLDGLFALGEHAALVAEGARAAGMPAERVAVGEDPEAVARALVAGLRGPAWILVKGSRAMRMERVVEALAGLLREAAPEDGARRREGREGA